MLSCRLWLLWVALLPILGCNHDKDRVIAVGITGSSVSASDFRTLGDYLRDPAVQELFRFMPRHQGASPPNVEGRYLAEGVVVVSSVPGGAPGDLVESDFCFGPPAGAALEVRVVDPTAVDSGAFSFIEGSGDLFTIYTAFKSVQTGPAGGTCEIHQVVVFSGTREVDGSLSSLSIGLGIVGLTGDCGGLAVDQVQVSDNTAGPPSGSCVGGATPSDPTKVLVEVDNFLVVDADIFLNGARVGTAPLLSSFFFEAAPGFELSFVTIRPQSATGPSGVPQGEVLAGTFPTDTQPAGRFSQYSISNQVGDDIYFAPVIVNQTAGVLTVRVNVGTLVASSCDCSLAPSPLARYTVGYHFYDSPNIPISASQTNVLIDTQFPAMNPPEFQFLGPFDLVPDSGTVAFRLP